MLYVWRKMKIDPYLSTCTKLKSKWIKDLHIKPETLKLIEEKVGKNYIDKVWSCGERGLSSSLGKTDLLKKVP